MPEGRGIFDVAVDGELIFSKYRTGCFPDEAEVAAVIVNRLS